MLRLQLYNLKRLISSPFIRNLRLFHSIYPSAARTSRQMTLQPLQFLKISLGQDLYPAVHEVPYVTLNAQGSGLAGHEPAKADALDSSRDEESKDHRDAPPSPPRRRRRYQST